MNNLLFIDSSQPNIFVAVQSVTGIHKQWCKRTWDSQRILCTIEEVLSKAQLSLSQLDAFAWSHGPGSFTGLRVGCAVIQGFTTVYRKPVIALSSLQITAQSVVTQYDATVMAIIEPADQRGCYLGLYRLDETSGLTQPIEADCYKSYNELTAFEAMPWFSRNQITSCPIEPIRPVELQTEALQLLWLNTEPMVFDRPIEPLYLNCPNYQKVAS